MFFNYLILINEEVITVSVVSFTCNKHTMFDIDWAINGIKWIIYWLTRTKLIFNNSIYNK